MTLEDLLKFQLKRVNPFQGLVIDADTWHDAHNYHREQLRLHYLAFHNVGIVDGLKVTANDPADLSVMIHPGVAITCNWPRFINRRRMGNARLWLMTKRHLVAIRALAVGFVRW